MLLSDDDVIMCEGGLHAMLRAWSLSRDQLVGIGARHHRALPPANPLQLAIAKAGGGGGGSTQLYQYQEAGAQGAHYRGYSLMTGRFNLVHRKYLRMFAEELPQSFRDYINTHKPTCEDMTLSFMISNRTGKPPLHIRAVEACRRTIEHGDMHASVTGWNMKRTLCLNRLAGEFGRMPLVHSRCNIALNASQLYEGS